MDNAEKMQEQKIGATLTVSPRAMMLFVWASP